jgi:hypothetical protein
MSLDPEKGWFDSKCAAAFALRIPLGFGCVVAMTVGKVARALSDSAINRRLAAFGGRRLDERSRNRLAVGGSPGFRVLPCSLMTKSVGPIDFHLFPIPTKAGVHTKDDQRSGCTSLISY